MNAITGLFSQYRGLRKEIYILFFGRVVTNLGSMVWPMLTMILSQKLGMDAFSISVYMVVSMAILMPANLLGGRMADRMNKKNIIVVCDSISIVCYMACALVPLGLPVVVLMLAAGICQSMEWPSYNALIADLTLTRDRERAYSLQYLGGNLGLVLSPTLAGLLFQNYLWLAFLTSGLAIACSTVLIFFRIRDITPVEDQSEEAVYQSAKEEAGLTAILRENRVLLLFIAASAIYTAAYSQYTYLMPLDMGRLHGAGGAVIFGTVSSLNCIVVVTFTPLITRIFRGLPDTGKVLAGILLVGAGYVLFLLLIGHIPAYYGAILLFTWGEIFHTIASGPYLSNRIPASHRGRINGFISVLGTLIESAAALAVGKLYDTVGRLSAWSLVLVMLAAAALLTVTLIGRDRAAYPKLYDPRPTDPVEARGEQVPPPAAVADCIHTSEQAP